MYVFRVSDFEFVHNGQFDSGGGAVRGSRRLGRRSTRRQGRWSFCLVVYLIYSHHSVISA